MADLGKAVAGVAPAENTIKIRRIVTGHDENGKAVFIEDRICPNRFAIGGKETFVTNEIWRQTETPADNDGAGCDTAAGDFDINPPAGGNVFRIMEFPPDAQLGVMEDGTPQPPMMHRTASLDYAVILKGEIHAVLDGGETLMKEGDVLIQRGTIHAWSNRSDKPCVILFVLCAAGRTPGMEYK